ncbi:ATP-binding protein [Paraburkholderia sp. IW21]|uniref:ATP-binding protein n=1 Tax=Paraburkholderia sp. IW21 TaxID=3242488 RepID=UPI00351FEAFE
MRDRQRMLGNGGQAERIRFYRQVVQERDDANAHRGAAFIERARHAFVEAQWELGEGRQTHIGAALSETRFAGRDVLLLGLVDINERKANESLLHEAKAAADRANQAKSMFLAVMSHEIRTPLHGALGNLELLSHTPLNAEQHGRVALIRRAFDSLIGIVNDILDLTKVEAHALKVSAAPVCLNDVLEHCAQNFAATILQRGLAFWCNTDPALDLQVEADEQRVTQIIQNLLSNAAKFTESGHIVLSSKLLRLLDGRLWVRIEVADSGIGIPAALQSSLFMPLAQADGTISRRFGGTGLGLFLCRKLAGLMDGRMTLTSEPGTGSVFAFELPVELVQAPYVPTDKPLSGLTVEVICEMPGWKHSLATRVEGWGATLLPQAASSGSTRAAPHIRLVAAPDGGASFPAVAAAATLGVVVASPAGPLLPDCQDDHVYVTSLSANSLLRALRSFTSDSSKAADAGHPKIEASNEPIWQPDILVAEDEPLSRMLISDQLNILGYNRVRHAQNGQEALQMWLDTPADVTITDISMPELDGIGLMGKIREHNPCALIVATTASGSSDTVAMEAGFSDVLHKPVSLADLRRVFTVLTHSRTPVPAMSADTIDNGNVSPLSIDPALHDAFAHSWKDDRTVLQEALRERLREKLRRRLHRLQGALLTIGADAVAADCSALELACATAQWDDLRGQCGQLIAKLDRRVQQLRQQGY